jgi:hypothetical protein
MGFDPHSSLSKVWVAYFLCQKNCFGGSEMLGPYSPVPGMAIPVCRITNGGCGRETLILTSLSLHTPAAGTAAHAPVASMMASCIQITGLVRSRCHVTYASDGQA